MNLIKGKLYNIFHKGEYKYESYSGLARYTGEIIKDDFGIFYGFLHPDEIFSYECLPHYYPLESIEEIIEIPTSVFEQSK